MKFLSFTQKQLSLLLSDLTKKDFEELLDFSDELITTDILMPIPSFVGTKAHRYKATKTMYEGLFFSLLSRNEFRIRFYNKLSMSKKSSLLYKILIWDQNEVDGSVYNETYNLNLYYQNKDNYGTWEYNLDGNLSLITHYTYYNFTGLDDDILFIKPSIKEILRLLFPLPNDFYIQSVEKLVVTKYSYNNEKNIFNFIITIEQLLKNNLVQFGKTNEKPLAKTLNMLYSTSSINEFYSIKKIDKLATDMLTRSFYYYYIHNKKFNTTALETLKSFILLQLNNELPFYISRIFASHLKKVRFDDYYSSENSLFDTIKYIINQLPHNSWVDVENIMNFCRYRKLEFHLESKYKTKEYKLDGDQEEGMYFPKIFYAKDYYNQIVFEPIIKAMLFYLGALGILELKYNDPKTIYENINAKNEEYISVWDGLKYIKFTNLGLYTIGVKDEYIVEEVKKDKQKIKFDQYKPIITVDKTDSVTIAKLDNFCTQLDSSRYTLDYTKIFKDCKNIKALELKIDSFYKNIEQNPPKVFKDFFDNIINNSNSLKSNNDEVVIQLNNNKKLLSLFLTNKKIQELIIKASGYRVIVLKKDLAKFTKIIKDNGFFIEF